MYIWCIFLPSMVELSLRVCASFVMCQLSDNHSYLFNEGRCYGCQNNGAVDMKHPKKANAYCRGQVDEYMPILGGYHIDQNYLAESVR
jgi:hypothetical protein